jgi:AAA domain/Bifunctional DNA primase/polymerase, N-terminal
MTLRDQLSVPNVGGMSLFGAALAYADAGWFVLPTDSANVRHPGSILGKKWQQRSSRDSDQIRKWWSENPNYGIALHCGRSGALVFDLDADDIDALPRPLAMALRGADAIQLTRNTGDRGHYVFAVPLGESFSNRAGAFAKFGEVRGTNGVIIAAPTPHAGGGNYDWVKTGTVRTPPHDALRECLSAANQTDVEPLTDAAFEGFLRTHDSDDRPGAMSVVLDSFRAEVDAGMSRHYAMVKALGFGYRDAIAGYYPVRRLIEQLGAAFDDAFENSRPGHRSEPSPNEFWDAARYVAAEERDADPELLRARKDGFTDRETYRAAQNALRPGGQWHVDTVKVWAGWAADDEAMPATGDGKRITRLLADVEPVKVRWLWRPWIPLGKVSILEGDPDVGKSLLTLAMAAIVSTGSAWPETRIDGNSVAQQESEPAGVVLVGVEDDEEDTIVPRLIAAGADRTRIATMRLPTDANGHPRPFVIPDDVERLRRAVNETSAQLVVIDPITAYLSTRSVKAGDDPSTRQALMPLVEIARETGCAILLVRHLNKATGMSAKHRGSGTIAYTGITRSVIVAGKLKETKPDGPTHAIALTKGNLTRDPHALGYKLNGAPDDPDTPIVRWLGAIDLNADQLVGADSAKVGDARKAAPIREECERVLRELLEDGPMRTDEVVTKTREVVNCSAKPVRNAADHIGIVKRAIRVDSKIDHWTWELPPTKVHLRVVEGDGDDE